MRLQTNSQPEPLGVIPGALVFVVIVASLWLGWQIVRDAVAKVAPPEMALRLAPDSSDVLTRAAQAELEGGRNDNAGRLATRALGRQPFNASALRIAGFVADREGDNVAADRMLTLAGNWSLRDSPLHSWLIGQRYRQGRSASALAHTDTLLRRGVATWPAYFDMMIAMTLKNDLQAQGALVQIMRRNPPWRSSFFEYASKKAEGIPVAAGAAIAMKAGVNPVTPTERSFVYDGLVRIGRPDLVRIMRNELEGTDWPTLAAGDFDGTGELPFAWHLPSAAGVLSEIADEPEGVQPALHVVINDISGHLVAEQLVLLTPGRWRLSGRFRMDEGPVSSRLVWTVMCSPGSSGRPLATISLADTPKSSWSRFSGVFDVPADRCIAQWLRLTSLPEDKRNSIEVWFDDVALTPAR